jgi:hypothetical protein
MCLSTVEGAVETSEKMCGSSNLHLKTREQWYVGRYYNGTVGQSIGTDLFLSCIWRKTGLGWYLGMVVVVVMMVAAVVVVAVAAVPAGGRLELIPDEADSQDIRAVSAVSSEFSRRDAFWGLLA